jgi:hypothetical protein
VITEALDFLRGRKSSYQTTFRNPPGEAVLQDLAHFCRAYLSTFNPDPYIAARMDGRREVFLRIQQHLNLTDDQLYQLLK